MIGLRRRPALAAGWSVGRLATGEPLIIATGLHLLVGGLSGTGKSSLLRCVLARVCRESVALALLDPKRVEFTDWKPRAEIVAVEPDDITNTLAALVGEMGRRYKVLADLGLNDWHENCGPRIVVMVDELAGVVATGDRRSDEANVRSIRQLLERGRACGIQIIAATQRPAADVVPTQLRDLFSTRIAFATANELSSEMVLGASWTQGPAHELPLGEQHAGKCWVIGEGERTPRLARVAWLSPADARLYARNSAEYRPDGWSLNLDKTSTPTTEPDDVEWLAALLGDPPAELEFLVNPPR